MFKYAQSECGVPHKLGLRPFMVIASLSSKLYDLAGHELSGMLDGTWSITSK